MTDIREYIKERILIFDGAMGTLLSDITPAGSLPELLCLSKKERISDIHEAYLSAGAMAIKTNTFGANRMNMSEEKCISVINTGFEIADKFSDRAYVFADIGPISVTDTEDITSEYIFVADSFLKLGAKHFIFETNSNLDGLIEVAEHIKKKLPDAYIIISFASLPDGFTRSGKAIRPLVEEASKCSCVDSVGLNCASGARHMSSIISKLGATSKVLCAMPNAGYPTVLGNRTFYEGNPEYFAKELAEMAHSGVKIIGGCCGTTPEHISRVSKVLNEYGAEKSKFGMDIRLSPKPQEKGILKDRDSFFSELCDEALRPFAVELDPPEGADISKFMKGAEELLAGGASVLTIADCPIARARMDSSLLACKVKRELGMNVLPHMTCRDRNLNAIKALLLGLYAEGIHNVLTVTGDPIPSAERSEVKSVYNFNSRMLADYITALGESELPMPFHIYGALNVNARNFDIQLKIAEQKEKCGVCAFLTQPILTHSAFENLKRARDTLGARILGGIFPLVSYKNACFMSSEVSGVRVDEKIISLYNGKSREECEGLALEISVEIAKRIYPFVDGYYIMTPFSRTSLVCRIMKEINETIL